MEPSGSSCSCSNAGLSYTQFELLKGCENWAMLTILKHLDTRRVEAQRSKDQRTRIYIHGHQIHLRVASFHIIQLSFFRDGVYGIRYLLNPLKFLGT